MDLERKLGYTFKRKALLKQALTHPSASGREDNQRLEFLGDAVLEFCVSDLLFGKYPQYREHVPEGPVILIAVTSWAGWAFA